MSDQNIHPATTWTHPETARFRPNSLLDRFLTICEEKTKSVKPDSETGHFGELTRLQNVRYRL